MKIKKIVEKSKLVDLGEATEQTKGYNFDRVWEAVHLDKVYDA